MIISRALISSLLEPSGMLGVRGVFVFCLFVAATLPFFSFLLHIGCLSIMLIRFYELDGIVVVGFFLLFLPVGCSEWRSPHGALDGVAPHDGCDRCFGGFAVELPVQPGYLVVEPADLVGLPVVPCL